MKFFLTLFAITLIFSGFSVTPALAQGTPPKCDEGYRVVTNPETGASACVSAAPLSPEEVAKVTGGEGNENPGKGGFWGGIFDALMSPFADLMLMLTAVLLRISGLALNLSIALSVVNMSEFINSVGTIDEGWRIIRDLINMSFIFILLYIAISTILGGGNKAKKLLISIVVVALTINFSLFMTKFIVDGSNIVALQFYKPLVPNIEESASLAGAWESSAGLANLFMDSVRAASLYEIDKETGMLILPETNTFSTVTFLGAILFLILTFIFFAGAILFIIRLVILMLLMVFSPVAFVGMMLPQAKSISSKWWKTLVDQALFAPVFMILIYLVARIVTSPGFTNMSSGDNLSGALSGGNIGAILNYIVVCAFLIATIIISKSLAGKGGDFAFKAAGAASFGVGAWAGRRTAGLAGSRLASNEKLEIAAKNRGFSGLMARGLIKSGDKVAGSSFDVRGAGFGKAVGVDAGKAQKGGYTKMAEDAKKREDAYADKATKAEARREARSQAEKLREAQYAQMAPGLQAALRTLETQGRVFLNNEMFEGEAGKARLQQMAEKEREEARKAHEGMSTEERLQKASRALDSEERKKAVLKEQELAQAKERERVFRQKIQAGQELSDAEKAQYQAAKQATARIQNEIYTGDRRVREYLGAREESAVSGKAFGGGLKQAKEFYGEQYADASFFGLPDTARREVAQEFRTQKGPKDKIFEAFKEAVEKGEINTGDATSSNRADTSSDDSSENS